MKKVPKPLAVAAFVLGVAGLVMAIFLSVPQSTGPSTQNVKSIVKDMTSNYQAPPLSREQAMEGVAGVAAPGKIKKN